MKQNIKDKVVVITGGSSGLGEAIARHLAALKAKVIVAARRKENLDKIVKDITESGGIASAYTVDITKKSQVDSMISDIVKKYGRIDVMVNNAGLMAIAPITQCRTDEWDRMIDINIKGVLYGIAATLPIFEKQGSGHFVNISSVAGLKVFSPGGVVYSGTKFAVRAISEGLRAEVSTKNIRVTCIEPGAVDSELKFGSGDVDSRNNIIEFYKSAISADSVARAVAYAMEQPDDVSINEIALRPTNQEF